MTTVHRAAVAGTFYPASAGQLGQVVDALLRAVRSGPLRPKALVVPHAGYVYSGPVAASAWGQLREPWPKRVVIIGPAHHHAVRGLALPAAEQLETPLGLLPVDAAAVERLRALPFVVHDERAHEREHALEVQLPFLQRLLPGCAVVPLAAGRATTAEVARVIDLLWDGEETLFAISSDLSHYLPYDEARASDAATARAILACDESLGPLGDDAACGHVGLRGMLHVARQRRLRVEQLDLRNSGDTAGGRGRVVGYGAFSFAEAP